MKLYIQSILAFIFAALLSFFAYYVYRGDQMMMLMTSQYTLPVAFLLGVSLFFFEEKGDERITHHQNVTDRIVLLVVFFVSIVVISFKTFTNSVDPLLLLIPLTILITKILLRLYFYFKN